MDDHRFSRMEQRVDEIKDDVAEVKADQRIMTSSLDSLKESTKELTEAVKYHVAGDDKIITEIQPIIEEFKFQQEIRKRRRERLKSIGLKLGVPTALLGLIATFMKVWTSF